MEISIPGQVVNEEGFIYVYLTNESNAEVYFDDFEVIVKESQVIQANDYYPFGLQHNTSWTRPTALKNKYLFNAGTELNEETALYETPFRRYDAAIGRFTGIDALAGIQTSMNPYHFGYNNPINYNDPTGLNARPAELDNMERGGGSVLFGSENFGAYFSNSVSGYWSHWADQYRPSWWGQGSGNWTLTAGNLSINYGALSDGVHHFGFSNGQVSDYGWAPDLNTPLMNATDANNYRTLTSMGYNVTVGDGRRLAQQNGNGDFVQVASDGKAYVPYTDVSYWGYARSQHTINPEGFDNLAGQPSNYLGAASSALLLSDEFRAGSTGKYVHATGKVFRNGFYGNQHLSKYVVQASKINTASTFRFVSKVSNGLALLGVASTTYDGLANGWENHHTADLVVTGLLYGATALGPVGWIAAGVYLAADLTTQYYTGKTITENLFD